MSKYAIKTLYSFTPQAPDKLADLKSALEIAAQQKSIIGLLILGKEGFNTTLSSTDENQLSSFIEEVKAILQVSETSMIKTSYSDKRPFRRFDVKVRNEIVTFDREDYLPQGEHRHLSPADWNKYMSRDDVVVIDTRNYYETKVGKFKNALDLNLEEFTDFSKKIKELDTDRSKPHLIYCTGGIRCEKAIYEMEAQGFNNVYQLEGGILNYLEQCPEQNFEGECFVFDSRVAVDQHLQPSKTVSLCPHCGDVSTLQVECLKCDSPTLLCEPCLDKAKIDLSLQTCSKNCRYHYKLHPDRKGPRQKYFFSE